MEILKKIKTKISSCIAKDSFLVVFLLLSITFLGAFLRMYEFHDWLRFNPDQGRDAIVAFDMTKGDIPLLGPLAGGTSFRLGPVTHYFSYISGLFFGFSPDALAYPDLLFSILTIPLIYLLVARIFGTRLGLLAALLVAISGFMVRYGRFQWNPNMMPFFTTIFLLAAQSFFDREVKQPFLWAIVFGIALGIGVQLHTFLFVLFPLLTIALGVFLIFRRLFSWKTFFLALGIAILLNGPQILSESRSGFLNTTAFFGGFLMHSENPSPLSQRIGRDALCHVRANAFIVTGLGHSGDCNRFIALVKEKKPLKHPIDIAHVIAEIVFTVGGFLLLGYFAWRERDDRKKFLLISILVYSFALFILIIPVANEILIRYFLSSAFVPFVLFSAWGAFFLERGRAFRIIFAVFVVALLVSNGLFLKKEFNSFRTGKVSNKDISVLGEVEPLSAFMSRNVSSGETAYLIGMRSYRKRFHKAFSFPLHIEGKELIRWEQGGFPDGTGPVFLVRKKTKSYDEAMEIDGRPILDRVTSGRVSVFLMRR